MTSFRCSLATTDQNKPLLWIFISKIYYQYTEGMVQGTTKGEEMQIHFQNSKQGIIF